MSAPTDALTETSTGAGTARERAGEIHGGGIRGVWCPVLTPVDADLAIDVRRFVAHARALLESGCHGLALFGTTGEATSFSAGERMALLDAALDAGLPAERLMVGTGCCALTDTVRLTAHAARNGCKRVLVLPPFYYKGVSDAGLADGYTRVIEDVADPALRVYLYHFPRLSAVPITAGLVEALAARHPAQIAGLKDSSGDVEGLRRWIAAFPALSVLPGAETLLLAGLEAGGGGCITATANANAAAIRAVWEAWQAGDAAVHARQATVAATRRAVEGWPMIPALKAIVAADRRDPGWLRLRPPLRPLDEAARRALAAACTAAGRAVGEATP